MILIPCSPRRNGCPTKTVRLWQSQLNTWRAPAPISTNRLTGMRWPFAEFDGSVHRDAGLISQERTEKSCLFPRFRCMKSISMHALFSSANSMTHDVIGSAIENFNVLKWSDSVSRLILPGANAE